MMCLLPLCYPICADSRVVKDISDGHLCHQNCNLWDLGSIQTALTKIQAQPKELLAWELRLPNAVTWELQLFSPP